MNGKYLSEVIDFKRDIEPFQVIRIYSGVGSGKNYWVETLAQMGYNILLITSRKATADAQAQKLGGQRWIDLETLLQSECEPEIQKKVIVTNAGIEQFMRKYFSPEDELTHLWRCFDFVIVDEAHSLVDDATFTDSPFHVKYFTRWIIHNDLPCKVIFMTGTPEPIEELFSEELKKSEKFNDLNFFDICNHVVPQNVVLLPTFFAVSYMVEQTLENHSRLIYFANSITRMEQLTKELIDEGVPEDYIGIAYSGNEKRKFPQKIQDQKERIREYILQKEKIPEDIKVFLTTNQNKEGINLNDDDIKYMYSESCGRSSLIQMAGRVRKGVEALFILYDANLHPAITTNAEMKLDSMCLPAVNKFWKKHGHLEDQKLIELIERKFPLIRYNYIENRLAIYSERLRGFQQARKDKRYIDSVVYDYFYFNGFTSRRDEQGEEQLVQPSEAAIENMKKWFPYSKIYIEGELSDKEQWLNLEKDFSDFLNKHNYIGNILNKGDKNRLTKELNDFLEEWRYDYHKLNIKLPIKQLNPFLRRFNYKIEEVKGHRKGTAFLVSRI